MSEEVVGPVYESTVYDRDSLKSDLKEWVCTVFFEKKDGSLRTMKCTLSRKLLPEQEEKETKKTENLETLSVWDLEKNAWRSFRLDKVKSVRYDAFVQ